MEVILDNGDRLPEFDTAFQDAQPAIYFHHIIDPVAATLRVEILGVNLTYTFHHERAQRLLSPSEITFRLERKTTGFLSLVVGDCSRRIVLAWAESGHGAGRLGDLLDPGPNVLANEVWTQRVIAVGKLLGIRMRRVFDGAVSRSMGQDMSGVFLGGHVEVKLAVHAVFVLLKTFNISQGLSSISRRQLRSLRQARWEDGSKPSFEIYFSRKHCPFCLSLVRRLSSMTGVQIKLVWKERLVKIVYPKARVGGPGMGNRNAPYPGRQIGPVDLDEEEEEEEDDETIITDDVTPVEYVDLTQDPRLLPYTTLHDSSFIEIIDLIDTDGQEGNSNSNSNNITIPSRSPSPTQPSSAAPAQEEHYVEDSYFDGLAYCVGQMEQCPHGAQAAIIELAEKVRSHRNSTNNKTQRVPVPLNHQAWANISKPLPATPETLPPGWMMAGLSETLPPANVHVSKGTIPTVPQLSSSSPESSTNEPITLTEQTAQAEQLLTPPTSASGPSNPLPNVREPSSFSEQRSPSPCERRHQQRKQEPEHHHNQEVTHHSGVSKRRHYSFRRAGTTKLNGKSNRSSSSSSSNSSSEKATQQH